MTSIAEVITRPSPATMRARRRFEHAKRLPADTAHWHYKHDTEIKTPHDIEREKKQAERDAARGHPLERYNTLTNHVFDGIAHLVYGWPHMADAAALIALEET